MFHFQIFRIVLYSSVMILVFNTEFSLLGMIKKQKNPARSLSLSNIESSNFYYNQKEPISTRKITCNIEVLEASITKQAEEIIEVLESFNKNSFPKKIENQKSPKPSLHKKIKNFINGNNRRYSQSDTISTTQELNLDLFCEKMRNLLHELDNIQSKYPNIAHNQAIHKLLKKLFLLSKEISCESSFEKQYILLTEKLGAYVCESDVDFIEISPREGLNS